MYFKSKKLLIICLIASLAISMLSGISAADITIDTKTGGGLKVAVEKVKNGDTIYLKDGIYTGEYNKNISIVKDIKIKGLGSKVVIDAKGEGTILKIRSKKVSIENIKFTNAKYNSEDRLRSEKVKSFGGAIATVLNSDLNVKNCIFTNNEGAVHGGAINSLGKLTVVNCIFTNNKASHGGAINFGEVPDDRISTATITDCTFTNNQAITGRGGAIFNTGAFLTVDKCVFKKNTAKTSGGAIDSHSSKITNSKFTGNTARDGGAIYGGFGDKTISKCTFYNNKASLLGGAIYSLYEPKYQIKILDSVFNNNIAGNKYNSFFNPSFYKITSKNNKISPKDGTKV